MNHPQISKQAHEAAELLPCPFCGRHAKLQKWPEFMGHNHYSVECTAESPFQCPSGRHYLLKSSEEAVAAWNTRAKSALDEQAKKISEFETLWKSAAYSRDKYFAKLRDQSKRCEEVVKLAEEYHGAKCGCKLCKALHNLNANEQEGR